jgi:hypothetical protein
MRNEALRYALFSSAVVSGETSFGAGCAAGVRGQFVGFDDEDDGAGVGAEGVGFLFGEDGAHAGVDVDIDRVRQLRHCNA